MRILRVDPLSGFVPSSSISSANKEVEHILEQSSEGEDKVPNQSAKRRRYEFFTPEEKTQVRKWAAEHDVTASTIRHLSKEFPGCSLKESSVRTWKIKYHQEIALRKRTGKGMVVKEISAKKSGRRLLLEEELDKRVQAYSVTSSEQLLSILL